VRDQLVDKKEALGIEGYLFQRPAFLVAFAAFLVAFAAFVTAFEAAFVAFVAAFVIFLAAFIILKINDCTKLSFLFNKVTLCLSLSQFYFNKWFYSGKCRRGKCWWLGEKPARSAGL